MALPTLWQAGMSLGGSGPTKPGGGPGGHLHLGAQEGGWGHAYIHTHAPMHSQLLTYLFPHSHTHTHNLSLTHMGHADFCTGLHSFRVSVSPLLGDTTPTRVLGHAAHSLLLGCSPHTRPTPRHAFFSVYAPARRP